MRRLTLLVTTMPTYHFRCPKGHDTDRFYKTISGAPAELACPECGEVATRQLSGGAGLLFKGSGFYLTDYGKNAHRKSEPKADTKTDKKADTKSDTKADAKADTSKPKAESVKPTPKSE